MIPIADFEPVLRDRLPETFSLLASANLVLHPSVTSGVLHGSRGLAGGYRSHSDIDLSLLVDSPDGQNQKIDLQELTETTLQAWRATVELDLAVIFELQPCQLKCFEQTSWDQDVCRLGGVDCFGIYKIQKGFHGLVTNAGIQVRLMYPCLKIWQRIPEKL